MWGWSRGEAALRAPCTAGGEVIALKGAVEDGRANLEHEVGASWRPAHLLLRRHPAVEQSMHRALRRGRRDRLQPSTLGAHSTERQLPQPVWELPAGIFTVRERNRLG